MPAELLLLFFPLSWHVERVRFGRLLGINHPKIALYVMQAERGREREKGYLPGGGRRRNEKEGEREKRRKRP